MIIEHINWEMLIAFTVLLTFHGSIFLRLAKNVFITKTEHELLSKKLDSRLFKNDGMPVYVPTEGCDRRQTERDRRQADHADRTCAAIKELKKEVQELRDIVLKKFPDATQ